MVSSGLGAQPANAKLPQYSCKLGCEASVGAEAGAEAKAEAGAEPVGFSAKTKAKTRFFQAVPHNGFFKLFALGYHSSSLQFTCLAEFPQILFAGRLCTEISLLFR